jgi:hypothetical protein
LVHLLESVFADGTVVVSVAVQAVIDTVEAHGSGFVWSLAIIDTHSTRAVSIADPAESGAYKALNTGSTDGVESDRTSDCLVVRRASDSIGDCAQEAEASVAIGSFIGIDTLIALGCGADTSSTENWTVRWGHTSRAIISRGLGTVGTHFTDVVCRASVASFD